MSGSRQRPGRAPAPWALYAKVVAASILFGGFVCAAVLLLATPLDRIEDWRALVDVVGRLFRLVVVPASFATALLGLVLLWPRRRALLRERWMQVKLVLIVATLPALHLAARTVFAAIRTEVTSEHASPEGPTGLLGLFQVLVLAAIAVLLLVLWIARTKPWSGR